MRKNDRQRWQLAQRYERDWWQHVADRTDLRYYRTYAEDLIRRIAPFFYDTTGYAYPGGR